MNKKKIRSISSCLQIIYKTATLKIQKTRKIIKKQLLEEFFTPWRFFPWILWFFLVWPEAATTDDKKKKGILRNFAKFRGKHLCQRLFFNKVVFLCFLFSFLIQVFSWEICEIFKNTFFIEHLLTTFSVWLFFRTYL